MPIRESDMPVDIVDGTARPGDGTAHAESTAAHETISPRPRHSPERK
jgi:hypothetical protein